jgi:hypothetical protein
MDAPNQEGLVRERTSPSDLQRWRILRRMRGRFGSPSQAAPCSKTVGRGSSPSAPAEDFQGNPAFSTATTTGIERVPNLTMHDQSGSPFAILTLRFRVESTSPFSVLTWRSLEPLSLRAGSPLRPRRGNPGSRTDQVVLQTCLDLRMVVTAAAARQQHRGQRQNPRNTDGALTASRCGLLPVASVAAGSH